MPFHLVTYATTKYRHRQILLTASAKANGIVATASSWTRAKLAASEFPKLATDISLSERGSGFWAWKPFLIHKALEAVPDGDVVFYCDVGRKYPYILLEHPLDAYLDWMDRQQQDIMPGILIPWNGPMAKWTKHDAFAATAMDREEIHSTSPIQASFSFWRAGAGSRAFVTEWLSLCIQRKLVSDDPSQSGPELPAFRGHRHDQSLLSLCCLKHGIHGIDLGPDEPAFNERDPGLVSAHLFGTTRRRTLTGSLFRLVASPLQATEQLLRKNLTFGTKYE
jgi:hypothetical protein